MTEKKKSFRFREGQLVYDVRLRRKFPLWIFLLLLPLLLLVRCEKELTVTCVEMETGAPVSYQDVTLSYEDHFIEKLGRWFSADTISLTQKTDTSGVTVFKKLPCSVYSYIFHGLEKGRVSLQSECYQSIDSRFIFHYTCHVTLKVDARREDLRVRVKDKETGEPLPHAIVRYSYFDAGESHRDSTLTDAAGVAVLPRMRYCSALDSLIGQAFGYYDDVKTGVPCHDLIFENDSTALRLMPVKEQFSFFVKNVKSKEPIPDAACLVTLTLPGNSMRTVSREVRTSIDGKGIAVYTDAPVVSSISIKASKVNYKDGFLADSPRGPWRVADFIPQPDTVRTIWLEPLPYVREFVNVDSLSGRPVPGVRNVITVTQPDGTRTVVTEISNTNGVFPISAAEDDVIDVISDKGGEYKIKKTFYPKFKDIENRQILMQPEMVELVFQTVVADPPSPLLPDCSLLVTGSISGLLPPGDSGDGVFRVSMRKAETLSIVSSKQGFKVNDITVANRDVAYLNADPYRRIIPMEWNLPPCDGGVQSSYSGPGFSTYSYSMGQMSGSAAIWVDFYSIGDYLTVYDGPSASGIPIINRLYIQDDRTIPFSFSKGAVTVVIESEPNSSGKFVVRCP